MPVNVTRGDFVLDYVATRPRPRAVPGRAAMGAMIVILLLALAATLSGRDTVGDAQGDAVTDVLMQGP